MILVIFPLVFVMALGSFWGAWGGGGGRKVGDFESEIFWTETLLDWFLMKA